MYSTFQSYILNSEKDISHMLVFSLREQHWELGPSRVFFYRQFPSSSSSFSKKIAERRSKNRALRSFFLFFFGAPFFPPVPTPCHRPTTESSHHRSSLGSLLLLFPDFGGVRDLVMSLMWLLLLLLFRSVGIYSAGSFTPVAAPYLIPPCLHPTTTYRN